MSRRHRFAALFGSPISCPRLVLSSGKVRGSDQPVDARGATLWAEKLERKVQQSGPLSGAEGAKAHGLVDISSQPRRWMGERGLLRG
jgi:hypothetical protein